MNLNLFVSHRNSYCFDIGYSWVLLLVAYDWGRNDGLILFVRWYRTGFHYNLWLLRNILLYVLLWSTLDLALIIHFLLPDNVCNSWKWEYDLHAFFFRLGHLKGLIIFLNFGILTNDLFLVFRHWRNFLWFLRLLNWLISAFCLFSSWFLW